MSKLIAISIDVKKLDKSRFYQGKKGTYAKLDVWIEDSPDQFGNDASISESLSKDERDAGAKKNYVGSGRKLFGWDDSPRPSSPPPPPANDDPTDDIPF